MAARPVSRLVCLWFSEASLSSVRTLSTVGPPRMEEVRPTTAREQPGPRIAELVFQHPKPSLNGNRNGSSLDNNNDDVEAGFEAAIKQLNSLQSNEVDRLNCINNTRINSKTDTVKYLERSGLPLEAVERLSFIHVAGTKGKGSTCALTESLLRHHGVRTGFFSSPHILSTNERIRIDGQPLDKDKFTEHFWKVYNRLWQLREHDKDMPAYFKFMTILCFHVVVAEQVDVTVLEVGIGGELDCTNILRNVRTVGITSLGLEHTDLLGNTLPEIAWQKAGIIKPGSHVYTHVTQPECLQVIQQRAKEFGAELYQVPPTEDYFSQDGPYAESWHSLNNVIRLNGSLAIQLASDWLTHQKKIPNAPKFPANEVHMDATILRGLVNTHWPGRCQVIDWRGMRLHLDGAHTLESMAVCMDWFTKSIQNSNNPKILIFNRTGESSFVKLLELLHRSCAFDQVCFVPNLATANPNAVSQVVVRFTGEMQLKRAKAIGQEWGLICAREEQEDRGQVYATVCEAFAGIRERYPDRELDVLVTGSIHLLGAAISALDLIDHV